MAGSSSMPTMIEESESESEPLDSQNLFVWDQSSQLYFHASSGFYHEPNAGWYYSTRDGLYYKFENGNYVLLQGDESEMSGIELENRNNGENGSQLNGNEEVEANQCEEEIGIEESNWENTECINDESPEIEPLLSNALEETFVSNCLLGSSNEVLDRCDDYVASPFKADKVDSVSESQTHVDAETYELEEGEWIPEDDFDETQLDENISSGGFSWEEENWKAQYGQVVKSSEEVVSQIHSMDLWDWSMIKIKGPRKKGTRKKGRGEIMKLVGRPMGRSVKLHPSMPCGGGRLKTAPISQVHLDLVRVITGQIYRLRNPSPKFLATLSAYDSSNPTKDWGFPELSLSEIESEVKGSVSIVESDFTPSHDHSIALEKEKNQSQNKAHMYRDRAAERRALHGEFGIAPGQKNLLENDNHDLASSSTEEAVAEALDMSFGEGSYARRILQGMGWKQGEGLGKTTKGLVEPIQAEGNIGSAGLGWPKGRSKPPRV